MVRFPLANRFFSSWGDFFPMDPIEIPLFASPRIQQKPHSSSLLPSFLTPDFLMARRRVLFPPLSEVACWSFQLGVAADPLFWRAKFARYTLHIFVCYNSEGTVRQFRSGESPPPFFLKPSG